MPSEWDNIPGDHPADPPVVEELVQRTLVAPAEPPDPPDLIERLRRDGPDIPFEDAPDPDGRHPVVGHSAAPSASHWLAQYHRMRDGIPGAIVFHRRRIGAYFRATMDHLIATIGPEAESKREPICLALVRGIYAHEHFHFHADIQRQLAGLPVATTHMQILLEEGLATAWGRTSVLTSFRGRTAVYASAVAWWFDGLSAPGYRDWLRYPSPAEFEQGFATLMGPQAPVLSLTPKFHKHWSSWCDYWIGGEFPSQLEIAPSGWRGTYYSRWAARCHETFVKWKTRWKEYA